MLQIARLCLFMDISTFSVFIFMPWAFNLSNKSIGLSFLLFAFCTTAWLVDFQAVFFTSRQEEF